MKVTIEIEFRHVEGTAEADPAVIADVVFGYVQWEAIEAGRAVDGKWVSAKYKPVGLRFVGAS